MSRVESSAAETIGKRIKGYRTTRLQITQLELMQLSGIDAANIRKYEGGKAMPSVPTLVRLAFVLGVDPGDLIRGIKPEDLHDTARETYRASDFIAERKRRLGD